MTITGPSPDDKITSAWTDALTNLANGFFQCASAAATATLNLGASAADVVGASVTVSVGGAHAFAVVTGCFDFKTTVGAGGAFLLGRLAVDGVEQPAQAPKDGATAGSEANVAQCWLVPLAAGTHTLKLRASANGSTSTCGLTHTTITAIVFDLP